jgi:type I restriction enzyme S subunit
MSADADTPSRSVPHLRFPEFRTRLGWPRRTIASVVKEHGLKSDGRSEVHSVSLAKGIVPQVEHMGRRFAATDTRHYNLVRPFDVVYTRSPLATHKLGIVKQHKGTGNAIVSPLYGVFAPSNEHLGKLIEAYFDSPSRSIAYLDPLAQKGAKNTIQLTNDRFLSGQLYLPEDEDEQQKVADCLRSLDELVVAERRALDLLRLHKRWLMLHLFPQEGESVPNLRFPEFRAAPDWVERKLGDLGKLIPGLTYRPADIRENGLLVLRSSNIQNDEINLEDRVYVRRDVNGANLTQKDDILICVRNGSRSLIGKSAIIPEAMPISTHGAFMTVFRAAAPPFVRALLQTTAYQKQVAARLGATINSINGSDLLNYRFMVPTSAAEQRRIASCLSSLDARLSAQSRKLSALKTHQQGLLQHLFPLPGDR